MKAWMDEEWRAFAGKVWAKHYPGSAFILEAADIVVLNAAVDEAKREEREACAAAVRLFQNSLKWSPLATDFEKELVLGNLNGAIAAILARDKEPRDAER